MKDRQSLINSIRDDIAKTGFPTEVVTSTVLSGDGWNTTLGQSYLDENTGSSREFDIRAYRQFRNYQADDGYILGVYLLIECKKSEKPWVIFTSSNKEDVSRDQRLGQYLQSPHATTDKLFWTDLSGESPYLPNTELLIHHHYFYEDKWGHNYYEPFKNRENSERSTQIYTAINSVINAVDFHMNRVGRTDRWRPIFYPVVVLDGDLFEAIVTAKDEVDIIERDEIVLKYNMIPKAEGKRESGFGGRTYLIDIIRSSHIQEFSRMLKREHQMLFEIIEERTRGAGVDK